VCSVMLENVVNSFEDDPFYFLRTILLHTPLQGAYSLPCNGSDR